MQGGHTEASSLHSSSFLLVELEFEKTKFRQVIPRWRIILRGLGGAISRLPMALMSVGVAVAEKRELTEIRLSSTYRRIL